jgi:hypothetical protein
MGEARNFASGDQSEGRFLIEVQKCVERTAEARAASRRTVQELLKRGNDTSSLFKSMKFVLVKRIVVRAGGAVTPRNDSDMWVVREHDSNFVL